ncbi:SGNH hydrolase-type esterase domain-containing protein, partial [Blyttiomyces helicus]
ANDAVLPAVNPHQTVPLPTYRANLHEMIQTLKSLPTPPRILLITPPPVDAHRWGTRTKPADQPPAVADREFAYTKQYRDVCIDVGKDERVPVVDTWPLFLGDSLAFDAGVLQDILSDGLHLAAEGNKRLGKAVLDLVLLEWPDLDPEAMPSVLPWHGDVDKTAIPETFFGRVRG